MIQTKKEFSNHLHYNWWKYAISAVLILVVWFSVFDSLAQLEANEKVDIVFFGAGFDYEKANDMLENNRSEISMQELKEIKFYASYTSAELIANTVQARSTNSDILIIPEILLVPNENNITQINAKNYFKELPLEQLSKLWSERGHGDLSSEELFSVDGVPYGIYINEAKPEGDKNNFEKHYIGGERCVAFFAPSSVNICSIYGKGNANDGACIDVLAFLMEDK